MPAPSIGPYRAKRDFSVTAEPEGEEGASGGGLFVVQKHAARRAGLHWDFRLEHDGVLWSWAVPKGPSLDPADRRMAIHVEDHPIEYAQFQGEIPAGSYGGGTVETWDVGKWQPIGDPDAGMQKGELQFTLSGRRLNGRFRLIRLRNRDNRKAEAWFLIKGHDEAAREGANAAVLEQDSTLPPPEPDTKPKPKPASSTSKAPVEGAKRGSLPEDQAPQLCRLVEQAPAGNAWLSEIKFDGYRLLVWIDQGGVRLITRNGLDWTARLPAVADAFAQLGIGPAVLDGELVALRPDGTTSFPDLQAALSSGRHDTLHFYVFDLLALDGWDLRDCRLIDRKSVLADLADWTGKIRYSQHVIGDADAVLRSAREQHLEGIVCKRANAPYRAGRQSSWVKMKLLGREEMVVLGWTPPAGSRTGLGALHVGYYDPAGKLHYAGGVGTGFSQQELTAIRQRLDGLKATGPPPDMQVTDEPVDRTITWVRPELVIEVQYAAWSGSGRLRHAVYLGLREDKMPREVIREIANPEAAREAAPKPRSLTSAIVRPSRATIPKAVVPPEPSAAPAPRVGRIVTAKAPKRPSVTVGGVELSHPERELWPGITKRDLANYWMAVAPHALPGLARRPLSIVRCPDGIAGERFFQKNGHGHLPHQIREGTVSGQPYLAIDDVDGLIALAQMSAIELHPWGAPEADPLHPDWLVFDLDPGEGVAFGQVVEAAHEMRDRLQRLGLQSFCRTTGGKGLHVVVPLAPDAEWDRAKPFCHALAEMMAQEAPERYVAHVKIADRAGRVLIDWLRNGLGATAVASFCPRARPGAGVATPLAWQEVTPKLDPSAFTLLTVPARLAKLKADPWAGFAELQQHLPDLRPPEPPTAPAKPRSGSRIVVARKPK